MLLPHPSVFHPFWCHIISAFYAVLLIPLLILLLEEINPFAFHFGNRRFSKSTLVFYISAHIYIYIYIYLHGRRLSFVYPDGAPLDRGVYCIQDEHGRVHGSPLQACKYQAHHYFHSVEGAGEGEQGVL